MSGTLAAWASSPQPYSDDLTLDWDGMRSEWLDKGVDVNISYVSETATNVQGGDRELARYTDQITFSTKLDLEKLLGLEQATFKFAITDRNGNNLSSDANLQSLQQVQELYGRDQTWRWTQFWYQQKYFGDLLTWKIGRITEGEDFAAFSCEFMNLTFCGAPPGNIVGSYWYNWPVSQWATDVKLSLDGLGYFQIGAFDVNSDYLQNKYSLDLWRPGSSSGVLVPVEIGWLPTFGDGLKGSYKFGAWYNSSTAPDVVENVFGQPLSINGGPPLMRHGQYGAYVNFLQQLTAPSADRGLSVFFNATYADRRTSTLDNQLAAGLLYKGPFDLRPTDTLGFAIGRTHVNSRIADVETQLNADNPGSVGVQGSEYAAELFYGVKLTRWLEVRPNVQYVVQPGGVARNSNDVIVGLRLSAGI
ncbi:MAG TPA: carbohydrate porin [Steroidobacteraceae bacterium]|nr:carbohydrate porin [Steroidobacteraceae bacterium]HUA23683.1 carbohydrate porin [Steroidobacteraceae bacterium]